MSRENFATHDRDIYTLFAVVVKVFSLRVTLRVLFDGHCDARQCQECLSILGSFLI